MMETGRCIIMVLVDEGTTIPTLVAWIVGAIMFFGMTGCILTMILQQPKSRIFALVIGLFAAAVFYGFAFVTFPFPMEVFN